MTVRAVLAAALCWAGPAGAVPLPEHEPLYGTWGTEAQCARALLLPGGTKLAEPVQIDADWLRQGQLWCRLAWFPVSQRPDGLFTGAFAQCGEDAVRDYRLGLFLENDMLTLRWTLTYAQGPLHRC